VILYIRALQEIQPSTLLEYKLAVIESNTKVVQWIEGESYKYIVPNDISFTVVNIPWTHKLAMPEVPSIATM
jgi:hypothetical protein